MLAAAAESRAWPFEEAKKIVERYGRTGFPETRAVRDRLRAVRPAAYRHVRRGRAHHHGAPCVPRADRRQGRRRGCCASPTTWTGCARCPTTCPTRRCCAAYLGKPLTRVPDPFGERVSVVRRGQQCAAARLPRPLRLRLRVRVVDRLLYGGPLRRDAAEDAGALRRGHGDHAAVAPRGAGADLFAVPADPSEDRRRHAGADRRAQGSTPARSSGATPTAASASRRRSPAATPSCSGSPTGRCAGRRSASTTRCRART